MQNPARKLFLPLIMSCLASDFRTAVENEVADNRFQRSELNYLIYKDPLAYANLVLNGDLEVYLNSVTEYRPLDS